MYTLIHSQTQLKLSFSLDCVYVCMYRPPKTYIYSSGSREAQRLIFGNTTYGDLRRHLCGFFDATIGYAVHLVSHLSAH